jgi:hypothetical protein
MDNFIVKQYISDDRPSLKGNGFDGLTIGESREEAQEFVDWLNLILIEWKRLREFQELAFCAHPNLDVDIEKLK